MKRVSIKDIAKSVSVSPTLVSMVLNNKGDENNISPKTQERVLAAAKAMNYFPNQAARSLRIGSSETIGLIVQDISNPFYAQIAGRIERQATEAGYNLMVCSTFENSEKEAELIRMLINRNTDGIILSGSAQNKALLEELQKDDYPFVLIDRKIGLTDVNYVSVDNTEGARRSTHFLLENGYREIAFLSVTPSDISTMTERKDGFIKAFEQKGVRHNAALHKVIRFDHIREDTEQALNELLKDYPTTEAIFSGNNSITKACLNVFTKLGLQIPDDMALISFDDPDWFAYANPPITAVAQPVKDIGDQAVKLLLNDIRKKGKAEKQQLCLSSEFIIRQSVK